jgi:hypothetical protein
VAIIGLLPAYVGPKYFSQIGQSEHKVARAGRCEQCGRDGLSRSTVR